MTTWVVKDEDGAYLPQLENEHGGGLLLAKGDSFESDFDFSDYPQFAKAGTKEALEVAPPVTKSKNKES